MSFWPLTLLAPAALVTLARGRSAWLWLSTASALAGLGLLLLIASSAWSRGEDGGLAARLLGVRSVDRAYHDTYYIVAHLHGLLTAFVPTLVVGLLLLLIPGHPRRTASDLVLFWAAAFLWAFVTLGPILLRGTGMPRRYVDDVDDVDDVDQIVQLTGWINLAASAAGLVTILAALRPLWLWARRRRVAA